MKKQQVDERREHARFKVKTGGLALLASEWPRSTVVGDILDISTGGVALQYVGDEPPFKDLDKIGLACSDPPFYLGQLPVKAISDFSMVKIPFGSLIPRRLSVQFGELTQSQATHLEGYIGDHSVASV